MRIRRSPMRGWWPASGSRRRGIAVLLATLALIAVACDEPVAQGPLLSDPREILSRGIDSTSFLRTVHLRLDMSTRTVVPGQPLQAPQTAAVDGDVDLAAGEVSLTGEATGGGGRFGLIIADGSMFVQSAMNGRWQQMPNMGAGIFGMALGGMPGAQQPDIKGILLKAAAEPKVETELVGVESCEGVPCYRVRVNVAPEVYWALVVELLGLENAGFGMGLGDMPPDLPALSTEVAFETSTFLLVEARLAVSDGGNDVSASLRLSGHDRPIAIQPPPPGLVDPLQMGF